MPTFGSLFAGIGGLDLGLERAGWECRWQVEVDDFCRRVLAKHWPDVPKFGDIREIAGEELGRVDLVCGGFPCQPFSLAGRRRGKEDDRYLWPEMLRVIQEVRPRWVFGENVAGLVSMGLDTVLSDLESIGYETAAFVIPACAVGAPHRRDRVWIVAYSAGVECQSGAEEQGVLRRVPADGKKCDNAGRSGEAQPGKDVADTESTECQRAGNTRERRNGLTNGGRRYTQSGVCRVFNGLSNWLHGHRWPAPFGCEQHDWEPPRLVSGKVPYRRQRLQALGNAVVPQVAEVIGRMILQTMREEG